MKRILFSNRNGVTLVEVLVAGIVAVVVLGAVFYAVSFSGTVTDRMLALQQMQLESSLISELFTRNVRNGSFICAGTADTAPSADVDSLQDITIRAVDSTQIAYFKISGTNLEMDGNRYLTSYLCNFSSPATRFKVFKNGKQVEFNLLMFKTVKGEDIHYSAVTGRLRCKN